MAALPSSLALTGGPADGALEIAAPLRNDFASLQAFCNALLAALGSGTAGQILVSGGAAAISFAAPPITTYRKTTAKTVNTTVAATDLLNGEITFAAGVMGTTGVAQLTAWGDWLQNSGGAAAPPRLQLVFGGTTLLDTGTSGTITAGATRYGWRITAEIMNLAAANAQVSALTFRAGAAFTSTTGNAFTTGEGIYGAVGNTGAGQMLDAAGTNPAAAVDTSVAKLLALNVINGSASATYETKLLGAFVEIL